MAQPTTNSKIEAEYRARTRGSESLYAEARQVIPAGLTHDSRTLLPYPIYATRAAGGRKWDVDGNEYVDYFGGHGALLLGHGHPAVLAAVERQLSLGTHWGACHELEVRWAEQVKGLIGCAERVRFTASGTEASQPGRCRILPAACRPASRPAWSSRPCCCRPMIYPACRRRWPAPRISPPSCWSLPAPPGVKCRCRPVSSPSSRSCRGATAWS